MPQFRDESVGGDQDMQLVASFNVLLALPGTEYVAYFPRGGTNSISLEPGRYSVEVARRNGQLLCNLIDYRL